MDQTVRNITTNSIYKAGNEESLHNKCYKQKGKINYYFIVETGEKRTNTINKS